MKRFISLPLPMLLRGVNLWLILIVVTWLSVGCSNFRPAGTSRLGPTPQVIVLGQDKGIASLLNSDVKEEIPVFICSSRNLEENPRGVDPFGYKRSLTFVPYLAKANVSIGAKLDAEQIIHESTREVRGKKSYIKVEKLKMYESPNITPNSTDDEKKLEFGKSEWLAEIRKELKRSERKTITVFVHGYNTHLVSNTERLAELYHYGGREGAVINYEWPSAGRLLGYFQDKGNAAFSERLFRSFVSRLAVLTGAEKIRIIAHSAGNPIVVNALKDMRLIDKELSPDQLQKKYKISQVILAAPDMDAMKFMNAVLDGFYEMAESVTVYANTKDRALIVTSKLFGVTRLGNAIGKITGWQKEAISGAKNVDLIDVSVAQGFFGTLLGHGYFYRDPWVSSDILSSRNEADPSKRGLVKEGDELFWKFTSDYPERLKKLGEGR